MRYTFDVDGQSLEMTLEPGGEPGLHRMEAEGEIHLLRCDPVAPHCYRLTVNGASFPVFVAPLEGGSTVSFNGQSYVVHDPKAAGSRKQRRGRTPEAQNEITPPMPSVVVRILVQEGECVQPGQPLVVVSAMKMETALRAPHAGRVNRIRTAVGEKVAPGDRLVEIEKEDPAHAP